MRIEWANSLVGGLLAIVATRQRLIGNRTMNDREFELHKLELEHQIQSRKQLVDHSWEKEKLDRQHMFEARKEYSREVTEYALQFDRHLKDYGQMALRTCILLNGGAIIALLTFIGSVVGKTVGKTEIAPALFVLPFSMFVAGLVCTVCSMTLAYLNYMTHHESRAEPGSLANNMISPQANWPGNFTPSNAIKVRWSWLLALAFGIGSIIFFGAGCYKVALVFSSLK